MNMKKKKILFISTGGTFASVKTEKGLKPKFTVEELLKFFLEAKEIADIDVLQLFNLDSTNIHPNHWTKMAESVAENYKKYDGFIIGHGTDTISYSSAALSFALKGILKPVVFTGSVLSIEEPGSDAKINFIDSVRVASNELIKEVCVCFHSEIIKGTRARKVTNEATKITNEKIGVYSSINLHLVGTVDLGKIVGNKIYFIKNGYPKKSKFDLLPKFSSEVGLVKIFPGISSSVLDCYQSKKAIIIEGFGPGNIPFAYSNWNKKIKEFTKNGIPVFIATQNPFGEVDMEKYETGQNAMDAGAIPCYDMTTESALVKLMWILGNYPNCDMKKIKELFLNNVCGEISDAKNPNKKNKKLGEFEKIK
jgi:L-asparaginase